MTEKEVPLPSQPDQVQSSRYYAEEEFSFSDLLATIVKRKVFILAITSIVTIFSIYYAHTLPPIYQASIGFMEPEESFLSVLPSEITKHLPGGGFENNPTLFLKFISKLMSFSSKEDVFRDSNFLKRFHGENSTFSMENAVLSAHLSINISKQKPAWVNDNYPGYNSSFFLKMEGTKPKVMADFLTALVESAKQSVTKEFNKQVKYLVDSNIRKISSEIKALKEEKNKENKLREAYFSEALHIAKELGIKDNNFDKVKNNNIEIGALNNSIASSLSGMLDKNQSEIRLQIKDNSLPIWFLYGEKALELEIKRYNTRIKESFTKGLFEKEAALNKFTSIDLSYIKPKVYNLSQPSITPKSPIKPNKREIVMLGMAFGLFVGIILALLRNSIDQLKKMQPFSNKENP